MKEEDLVKNSCSLKVREEELEKKERAVDMKIKNTVEHFSAREKRAKDTLIQAKKRIVSLKEENARLMAQWQRSVSCSEKLLELDPRMNDYNDI